jgi:EpsI family protein
MGLFADLERRPRAQPIRLIAAAAVILLAAVLAKVLEPHKLMARGAAEPALEQVIPLQFGPWRAVPGGLLVPADPDVQPDADSGLIYGQEVGRQYVDNQGRIVMLIVAYGSVQNAKLKAHRPEICYTAAGFRVSPTYTDWLDTGTGAPLKVTRLTTERESRFEPITYWMRVGNDVTAGIVDRQWARLKYGLRGFIPDGALIRVSTVGLPAEAAFELQEQFIRDLLAAVPKHEVRFFTGRG